MKEKNLWRETYLLTAYTTQDRTKALNIEDKGNYGFRAFSRSSLVQDKCSIRVGHCKQQLPSCDVCVYVHALLIVHHASIVINKVSVMS